MFKLITLIWLIGVHGIGFSSESTEYDDTPFNKIKKADSAEISEALKDPIPTKEDLISHWRDLDSEKKAVIKSRYDFYKERIPSELEELPSGNNSRTALDIGTGSGCAAEKLYQKGYIVAAVDPDLNEISAGCTFGSFDDVELYPTTLQNLPEELNGTFDVATYCHFLIGPLQQASFFGRLNKLMKQDGVVHLFFADNDFDYLMRNDSCVEIFGYFASVRIYPVANPSIFYTHVELSHPTPRKFNITVHECFALMDFLIQQSKTENNRTHKCFLMPRPQAKELPRIQVFEQHYMDITNSKLNILFPEFSTLELGNTSGKTPVTDSPDFVESVAVLQSK